MIVIGIGIDACARERERDRERKRARRSSSKSPRHFIHTLLNPQLRPPSTVPDPPRSPHDPIRTQKNLAPTWKKSKRCAQSESAIAPSHRPIATGRGVQPTAAPIERSPLGRAPVRDGRRRRPRAGAMRRGDVPAGGIAREMVGVDASARDIHAGEVRRCASARDMTREPPRRPSIPIVIRSHHRGGVAETDDGATRGGGDATSRACGGDDGWMDGNNARETAARVGRRSARARRRGDDGVDGRVCDYSRRRAGAGAV